MRGEQVLKRILFMVCTVVTVLLGSNCMVYADEYEENGSTYEYSILTDGTVKITDYTGANESITIPSKIYDKNVTVIGAHAFSNATCSSVTIPDTVTTIEEWAFTDSKIQSITIPKNVKKIKYKAFLDCKKLETITLHDELEELGYSAFYNCTSLKEIKIPTSITEIDTWMFTGCSSLTSITIPKNITTIGKEAFRDCTSLSNIVIEGTNAGLIEEGAFDNTAWYNSQPDGVLYFGNALYGYKGTMPENTTIAVKDGTQYIVNNAFEDQSNLIGITFPNSLTKIGRYVFYKCTGLREAALPDTVTSIGMAIFQGCTSLEKVKLPSQCKSIPQYAFYQCSNLKEIDIPESATYIGSYAFYQCTSLASVYIPKNIEQISGTALSDMDGVQVVIAEENPYFTSENGVIYNKEKTVLMACLGDAEQIVIPDTVKEIANVAFGSNHKVKEIEIPDSVTKIGNSAFSFCTALQSLSIPDSVTEFGGSVFIGCTSIKSIKMPSKITSVAQLTFSGCENLEYVKLPEALKIIGDSAFEGCSSLKSIRIPTGVTRIYIDAFCDCAAIETLIIPDSVTSIGATILDESNPNAVIYCSANSKARKYAISNSYLYDNWENAPYVDAVSNLKVTNITTNSAKLTWDKVEDAEGYAISKYDSANKTWTTVANTTSVSYTVTNLSDNTQYIYGVNTYKTVNGKKVQGNVHTKVDFKMNEMTQTKEDDPENSDNDGKSGADNTTSLAKAEVKLSQTSYNYNGKAKKPTVAVALNGKTLKNGTDYTVSYKSNKNIGTAKVTVSGIGKYNESVSKSFSIKAKKGTTVTAGKYKYTFTGESTVAFAGISNAKTTKITVEKAVKIGGKNFKVTSVADKALYKKTNITSVTIGGNVKKIGVSAFEGCTKLSKVTIGSSVTTIGKKAFKNCKKLATITVNSKKLKSVGKDALKGIKSTANIKVPKSKVTSYKKLFKGKGQSSKVKIKK